MAHSNGIITAPVSFGDVNAVLRTSHTDLESLCRDANVNKWAKFKPVINPLIDNITGQWDASNNTWLSGVTWYKSTQAQNYNCGVDMRLSDAADPQMRVIAKNYADGIARIIPSGGSASPYRLQDFASYYHNAQPFIRSNKAKNTEYNVNRFISDVLHIGVLFSIHPLALSPADFPNLSAVSSGGINDVVLGVAVYDDDPSVNSSANLLRSSLAEDSVVDGGGVDIQFSDAETGTRRYVMLFLANNKVSRSYVIPFDDANYGIFKVNVSYDISAVMHITMGVVTVLNGSTVIASGTRVAEYNQSSQAMPVRDNYSYRIICTIENKNTTEVKIGKSTAAVDYSLELVLQNRNYGGEFYPVDPSDSYRDYVLTIPASQSRTVELRADTPFSGFWDTYVSSVLTTNSTISVWAVPKVTGGQGDFVASDTVPIYVTRE